MATKELLQLEIISRRLDGGKKSGTFLKLGFVVPDFSIPQVPALVMKQQSRHKLKQVK